MAKNGRAPSRTVLMEVSNCIDHDHIQFGSITICPMILSGADDPDHNLELYLMRLF